MLHTIGTRRKFKTASERLTGPQHSQKWQPKHQRKEDADDDGPAHVSDLYSRPSSSSITSAQVVTGGKELIDMPRCSRCPAYGPGIAGGLHRPSAQRLGDFHSIG